MDMEKIMLEVRKQFFNHDNETSDGEPQAFVSLDNGRSIEITLHKSEGSPANSYYIAKLYCSDEERASGEYKGTHGVMYNWLSVSDDIEEVRPLIEQALRHNKYFPLKRNSEFLQEILDKYFYSGPAEYGKAYDRLLSLITDLETLGALQDANSIKVRLDEIR